MVLAYYTRCGFNSLDDQMHVLKEEKSKSVNNASENMDKVGLKILLLKENTEIITSSSDLQANLQ